MNKLEYVRFHQQITCATSTECYTQVNKKEGALCEKKNRLTFIFFGTIGILFYINFIGSHVIPFYLNLAVFVLGNISLHFGYTTLEKEYEIAKWIIGFTAVLTGLVSIAVKSQTSPIIGLIVGTFLNVFLMGSVRKYLSYLKRRKESNIK